MNMNLPYTGLELMGKGCAAYEALNIMANALATAARGSFREDFNDFPAAVIFKKRTPLGFNIK